MSDNKVLTTEEKVKHGIRRLLLDDVNTLLGGFASTSHFWNSGRTADGRSRFRP